MTEILKFPTGGRMHRLVEADDARRIEVMRRTQESLGICFPEEYLCRGTSLVLMDHRTNIHGAAILVDQPPFRSLEGIPISHRRRAIESTPADDLAEINGVWISDQARSAVVSFAFWTQLLQHLLDCRISQFLFTFDNTNARMGSLMRWACPEIVYSGPTQQLAGMTSPADETIALLDQTVIHQFLRLIRQMKTGPRDSAEANLVDRLSCRSRRRMAA